MNAYIENDQLILKMFILWIFIQFNMGVGNIC